MDAPTTLVWDEDAEYQGEWWPAEDRTVTFQGILTFSKRLPRLTIVVGPVGQEFSRLARPQSVHGQLASGQLVTLWDTQGHHLQFVSDEDDSIRHVRRFTHAILGDAVDSYDEARFRYSAFRLHGLDRWSAMEQYLVPRGLPADEVPQYPPARLTGFHTDEDGTNYSATVRIENPRRLEADEEDPTGYISTYTGHDVRIVFECEPSAPARVHDLLLFDLQALLTFSYQAGAPLEAEWIGDSTKGLLPVLRADPFTGDKPLAEVFPQRMIMTVSSVGADQIFPMWWRAVHELYPAIQVIYLYHHGSRGLLESSTSSAIAVAERLHGIVGPTLTKFPEGFLDSQQKRLRKVVRQEFPGPDYALFRQHLYDSLKNNRPTLRTRLEELAEAVTPGRMAALGVDPTQWISEVRRVRDILAHTASHVNQRGTDSAKLLQRVNAQTRVIVTILILRLMGLPADEIDRAALVLRRELRLAGWNPPSLKKHRNASDSER